MKYRKITAVILAVATAICAAGCNGNDNSGTSSSGDVTSSGSGDSSITSDNTTSGGNSGTPQAQFTFSQVAMGGGGFVSGVFATSEEGLYYARTDVGGSYRYNKDTQKWEAMSYDISEEDRGLLGIDGLAFGEKDPNRVYMLAGTEYFSNGLTCLLYSDDYGKTWNRTDLTEMIKAHGNGMGRGNGERIAVDPKNSDIVYVGGRTGGMIKSTDGGKTFTALDMGTNTSTSNGNGICSIIIDPKSGDDSACTTIYAAISRTQEDNLYKSTDGGATWNPVADAPKGFFTQRMKYNGDGKIAITYASAEGPWNNNRTSGGIRLLDMSNDTFTDITPVKKSYGDIVIDPANPDRMVACTENIYVPQPNGQFGDEFYVTTDGGKNWTLLNEKMKMSDGGVEWISTASMHWCSSMAIDPNNTNKVMVVSGNGIFTCDNIWDENPEFYFFSKGIEETVPYDIISIPGGKLVSVIGDYDGFAQDNAEEYGVVHSSVAGSMTGLAVAAKATDTWVKCGGDEEKPGFWYTLDAGKTWNNVKYSPLESKKVAYGGYVGVSADGKRFFWAPGNDSSIYYSDDLGKTWTKSEGGVGAKKIICDPVNPDYVYAASGGAFFYSEDGGKTFTQNMTLSIFTAARPVVAPGKEGVVYYPAMGLQVSTDYGKTFTRMDTLAACMAVGLGKGKTDSDPYTIFVWGKPTNDDPMGLYWSEDEGKTWSRANDDEHQFGGPGNGYFVAGDMNTYGRVYMSTVGLGVVYGDLVQ
jgi:xyloglucan-specific exo-beta-1,4-glucanase